MRTKNANGSRMPNPELGDVRRAADQIVGEGSVITLPALPLQRFLVGHFEWIGENAAFAFPAFGERPADGHLIVFSQIVHTMTGVCFLHDTKISAYLCTIEKSAVDDLDDYRVAWQLWQEVFPRRRRFIRSVCDQLAAGAPAAGLAAGALLASAGSRAEETR